jgi:hypothetical protein
MSQPGIDTVRSAPLASPPLVAVAGWLVPGAGYWLIGERARALTVGVTIVALFVLGMLIGGARAIQVPGFGENGGKLYLAKESRYINGRTATVLVPKEASGDGDPPGRWIGTDPGALLRDVGNKPWSICQVLAGPVAIAGGAWSVALSRPVEQPDGVVKATGVQSHSRVNEIGVLYMAVAGMLNLLVIIDAAARAGRGQAVGGRIGSVAEAA